MLHAAYRILKRVSPSSAYLISEWNSTLTGQREARLQQWMETYFTQSRPSHLPFAHTIAQLSDTQSTDRKPIAFVSVLPPSETGIAGYSFRSWQGSTDDVDIFCPAVDDDWFFANSKAMERSSDRVRVLDVRALAAALTCIPYRAIVVVVGNSPHHMYAFDVLKKISALNLASITHLYLHDICLLSLIHDALGVGSGEFIRVMQETYACRAVDFRTLAPRDKWAAIEALVDKTVFGPRFFLERFGVRSFLVNSDSARRLCAADLGDKNARISRVFLPIPSPSELGACDQPLRSSDRVVIGTFGVPGEEKRTPVVLAAAQELKRRGIPIRVVLSGYGCRRWLAVHGDASAGLDIEAEDSLSQPDFTRLMAKADIAIQLRARNLGESSGAVAELLGLRRNIIVSDIGSFKEYGACVHTIPVNAGASTVAEAVVALLKAPIPASAISEFVAAHDSRAFRERLSEVLSADRVNSPGREDSASHAPKCAVQGCRGFANPQLALSA
jgi:glycosyltransferase involved in cell wall biosynthesis